MCLNPKPQPYTLTLLCGCTLCCRTYGLGPGNPVNEPAGSSQFCFGSCKGTYYSTNFDSPTYRCLPDGSPEYANTDVCYGP
jgi:hypothetical protein